MCAETSIAQLEQLTQLASTLANGVGRHDSDIVAKFVFASLTNAKTMADQIARLRQPTGMRKTRQMDGGAVDSQQNPHGEWARRTGNNAA